MSVKTEKDYDRLLERHASAKQALEKARSKICAGSREKKHGAKSAVEHKEHSLRGLVIELDGKTSSLDCTRFVNNLADAIFLVTGTYGVEIGIIPHGVVLRFFTPGLEDIEMDVIRTRARVCACTGGVKIASMDTVGDLAERSKRVPAHVIEGKINIGGEKHDVRVKIDNAHELLIKATPKIILAAIKANIDLALRQGNKLDGLDRIELALSSEGDFDEDGVVVVRVSESDTKPTATFVVEIDPMEPIAYLQ